jgi:hypothetical protein
MPHPGGASSTHDSASFTSRPDGAERDDGQSFIVRVEEKLSAFLELESAIRSCAELA